jgi:hypothetical protein
MAKNNNASSPASGAILANNGSGSGPAAAAGLTLTVGGARPPSASAPSVLAPGRQTQSSSSSSSPSSSSSSSPPSPVADPLQRPLCVELKCANPCCEKETPHQNGTCEVFPGLPFCATCCMLLEKQFPIFGKKCKRRGRRGKTTKEANSEIASRIAGLASVIAKVYIAEEQQSRASPATQAQKSKHSLDSKNAKILARSVVPKPRKNGKEEAESEDENSEFSSSEDEDESLLDEMMRSAVGADNEDENEEYVARTGLADVIENLPVSGSKRKSDVQNPFFKKSSSLSIEMGLNGKARRVMIKAPGVVSRGVKSKDLCLWSLDTLGELSEILTETKDYSFMDSTTKEMMTETLALIEDHITVIRSTATVKKGDSRLLSMILKQKMAILLKVRRISTRHVASQSQRCQMAPFVGFLKSYCDKVKDAAIFPVGKMNSSKDGGFRSSIRNSTGSNYESYKQNDGRSGGGARYGNNGGGYSSGYGNNGGSGRSGFGGGGGSGGGYGRGGSYGQNGRRFGSGRGGGRGSGYQGTGHR